MWLTASILAWTRGGSPSNIAPSHGEGVWGFGKDAEIERPKALQDAKPTKRSYRDREFALSYKNILFLQSNDSHDTRSWLSYLFDSCYSAAFTDSNSSIISCEGFLSRSDTTTIAASATMKAGRSS